MQGVPRAALWLGLAGLLPMIWGVAELYLPFLRRVAIEWGHEAFRAPYATLRYAQIILCFMSGVLWGFAALAPKSTAPLAYFLSVLPALYAFFFAMSGGLDAVAIKLAIGFVIVLAIDRLFHRQDLTPDWWMRLRVPLSAGMVICLLLVAAASGFPFF